MPSKTNPKYTPERYQKYKDAFDRARNNYIKGTGLEKHRIWAKESMRRFRAKIKECQ